MSKPNAIRFHLTIFLAAVGTLIIGALWRGGQDESGGEPDMALIEQLRQEVSGLQVGLKVGELSAIQETIRRAAGTVSGAVVSVRPAQDLQPAGRIRIYSDHPAAAEPHPATPLTSGLSGIILDSEGYVATSANVAGYGPDIVVVLADGTESGASVVGIDAQAFIALLKMNPPIPALPPMDFSRRDVDLRPGEWLIRQGRTRSGRESLSLCLLESIRFNEEGRPRGIVENAAAPEMDGGLVTGVNGRIVGIYVAPPQAPASVVPAEFALSVVHRLKTRPQPGVRSWIGVGLQDLGENLAEYFGVKSGAIVNNVVPGSPAADAGLMPSDVIVMVDDNPVASAEQLLAVITERPPASEITLQLLRNSNSRQAVVKTVEYPQPSPEAVSGLVLSIENTPAGPAIVHAAPTALANRLGLFPGDVIVRIDAQNARTAARTRQLLAAPQQERPRLFEIRRGEQTLFIAIREPVTLDE